MGIQENINRTIGSLATLLGAMKIKKSIDPKKVSEPKEVKNEATTNENNVQDALVPEQDMKKTDQDVKTSDNSNDTLTPNDINPYVAAEKAQTAIDNKQLEYSFSKPKATIIPFEPKGYKKAKIIPFEPKDSKKATVIPFEPKNSKKATILPFEPKD